MLRQCIEVVGLRRGGEIVVISQFEWYRECRLCIYTRLKAIVALRRVLFFQKQYKSNRNGGNHKWMQANIM